MAMLYVWNVRLQARRTEVLVAPSNNHVLENPLP